MNRDRYPVSVMCQFFEVSRSGYYDFLRRIGCKEKDVDLAEMIRAQQERCFKTYGYRRMWLWLKKQGIYRNPKTILRIMKKYELLADIRRRRKWVQMGAADSQVRESSQPTVSCKLSQQQVGN